MTRLVCIGIGTGFTASGNPLLGVTERVSQLRARASHHFGGCNITQGHGSWDPQDGRDPIHETSLVVSIYTDRSTSYIESFARWVAGLFSQESVILSIQALEHFSLVPAHLHVVEASAPVSKGAAA